MGESLRGTTELPGSQEKLQKYRLPQAIVPTRALDPESSFPLLCFSQLSEWKNHLEGKGEMQP